MSFEKMGQKSKAQETMPAQENVREMQRVMAECTQKIVESALPDEHKAILTKDIQKLEQAYAGKRNWNEVPSGFADIQSMKKYEAKQALWSGDLPDEE